MIYIFGQSPAIFPIHSLSEIIASACSFGQYQAQDLRGANERGIRHVIQCFEKSFYPDGFEQRVVDERSQKNDKSVLERSKQLAQADCDELFNNPELGRR